MASSTLTAKYKASSGLSAKYGASSTLGTTHTINVRVVKDGALVNGATLTRADSATYFDSNGLLQTAAANEARTTYIDGNPYLLMEGSRTNVLLHSKWLGGDHPTGWGRPLTGTGTTSAQDHGSVDAKQIKFDCPASGDRAFVQQVVGGLSPNTEYTVSVRVIEKGLDAAEQILLAFGDVVATESVTADNVSADETVEVTFTTDATNPASVTVRAGLGVSSGVSTTGHMTLLAPQVEEGLFASSRILTEASTVSRSADSASLSNSVIAGLTEGTLYMEVLSLGLTSAAARHIAELESDANNFIRVQHATDGDLDAQITSGGVSQATLAGTDLTVGTKQKIALAFDGSDYALYRDGTQEATAASGTMPSVDTLLIGAGLYGGIRNMNVYTVRKSNAELVTLTT